MMRNNNHEKVLFDDPFGIRVISFTILFLLVAGCNPFPGTAATASANDLPQLSDEQTDTPLSNPVSGLWIDPALPGVIKDIARETGLPDAESMDTAATQLVAVYGPETDQHVKSIQWIYALVGPFPSLIDGVSLVDIHSVWNGGIDSIFSDQTFNRGTIGL